MVFWSCQNIRKQGQSGLVGSLSAIAQRFQAQWVGAQAVLVRISARLLKKTLLRTDERAKLEGELLDGIDVVKCMTWEVNLLTYMLSV